MIAIRTWVAAAAMAALVAGCGLVGRGPAAFGEELTLHVTNQNFYDATLYATWASHQMRLGTVIGHDSNTFAFRWRPANLRIEIRLLSVGSYFTEPMAVAPGEELELVIQPDLHRRITRSERTEGR
jgi:hypothetical protein